MHAHTSTPLKQRHQLNQRRDICRQRGAAELAQALCWLVLDLPAAVVVQGDTTTALAGALTAFWRQIPVVHLEAGLRSHDLAAPFPEEANRKMVDQIAALHLAPTPGAAANLRAEGVAPECIQVIGNTVVDAVMTLAGRTLRCRDPALAAVEDGLASGRRLVLVTAHRRESWGAPLRRVLGAVRDVLAAHPDVIVALPVHPNPAVRADMVAVLGSDRRVVITPPLDYPDLVRLLERSTFGVERLRRNSGRGAQLRSAVLVLRERTERLEAGCATLVGTDRKRIVTEACRLLSNTVGGTGANGDRLPNPFGDGHSGERAVAAIAGMLDGDG